MNRARGALHVLPALLPGALVVLLAFQSGGFYPTSWAPVAAVGAVALAIRVATVDRPFAGFSAWSGVAAGALALFGAWMLLSAQWSDAPGRALVEFGRLLAYLLVLVLCASMAPRENRLAWAVRGVAVAIGVVCVAALITRLRPDVWNGEGLFASRLDYPITYWNGLGVLAAIGAVLGFHLSASEREPRVVRVLAAALPPICACTVYFTLSRGGIAAGIIGLAVYLVIGFSRATPSALLALLPPTVIALRRAYDADLLVSSDFASRAGLAQGRDVAEALAIAVGAAIVLRALTLLVDHVLARAPGPSRLPRPARFGAAAGAVALIAIVAVAVGAPGYAYRQADTFLDASPVDTGTDQRDRLTVVNNNGRVDQWRVALDAFRTDPLRGTGAGTYQNRWNLDRPGPGQVLDGHSLYLETLGEMGYVGAALVVVALLAMLVGLLVRARGPNRPTVAAALAAVTAWAVHAGADWDWELAAVSIWVFGLAGIGLAPRAFVERRPMPRLLRLIVALGCLALALSPFALWRSQDKLNESVTAFQAGDCRTTVDAALDSLGAMGTRGEPWELIAYCDVRLGQDKLAVGAAKAAVRRDPGNWEYHYALALVQGATRDDPRPAAAEALRLNPLQREAQDAVKAFRTKKPAQWERRARRLPLYFQ